MEAAIGLKPLKIGNLVAKHPVIQGGMGVGVPALFPAYGQNDTVIVDDRQAVSMDVEAIVTVEVRLNAGHRRACAQQGLQDAAPLFLFVGSGAVVLPAQLLCTVLFLRGGVFIAADIGGRAFHNIQSVHRVCPFHTVYFQELCHILCRCVIGCFSSFVCPLDLLHRFALSQLIHQLSK